MVPFVAPQRPQEASRYAPTLQDGIVTNSSDFGEGDHSTRVVGAWKDSLFSCCDHGPFHPHVWMSFCCRPRKFNGMTVNGGQCDPLLPCFRLVPNDCTHQTVSLPVSVCVCVFLIQLLSQWS